MKTLLTTILLSLTAILPTKAANHEVPLIQNVPADESLSLHGEWNYIVDVQEEGYYDYRMNPTRWGFFQNAKPQRPEDLIEYDFDKSPTMQIPADWNTQDERLFFYEGTVWFKRSFNFSPLTIPELRSPTRSLSHLSPLKDAVVSFNVGNIHHLDMGTLLDRLGIAVRTGHHCAQPLMDRLGISGTVRASFALYNTKEEVDTLVAGIRRVAQMF